MQDLTGQTIKGYNLGKRIAVGGFGEVYRAFQESVGREVAVKIILPEYANQPDFIRRFEIEAHLVARLEHPYIVPLYDYWRDPDGAYLVMRWLRGGNLHDKLGEGPLELHQVLQMLDQVGTALAAAHRRGVVHRDLKPSNILLDEDGNAYLADFGIAKDLASTASPYQTLKGTVVGSPAYSSPEQIESQPITPQTDIYSLGVMLYEILTGELPFKSTTPVGFYFKHIHDPVPPLAIHRKDLPDTLNSVIQRATAKQPSSRYPDITSMVEDYRRALDIGTGTTSTAYTPGRAAPGASTPGGSSLPRTSSAPATNGRASANRSGYETVLYDPAVLDLPINNPYKGLRAFQEADQDDFFGREALVQHLLARMNKGSVLSHSLAVVGPSGSGKSSVVRAGLVPAIRSGALPGSDHWFVADMFPGARPLEELASALLGVAVNRPPNLLELLQENEYGLLKVLKLVLPTETELLLVIDQFEEVFTLVEDETARTHFLNSLLAAVTAPDSGLRLIFTLRADFYDRPLLYPGFSELIRRRTEVVIPLSEEELRAAITRPAELVGVSFDPELVTTIVRDVGEQPGALPLLQYVLTELFERRSGARIPLEAYRNIGGVLGALSRRADEIYESLDAPSQQAAEQLFLRLVTLGEGAEDTRRRVPLTELSSVGSDPQLLEGVIATYSTYRLLTFDHDPNTRTPTVEVAHEALIRTWGRLRKWLDGSRDDLRLQRRLGAAAVEWLAAGRDRSYLASGARLEQFDTWARDTRIVLNNEERAYLDASVQERDAQRVQEEARQKRELELTRRARNVLRVLAVVLFVAALGAVGLSIFAFGEGNRATAQAERAATSEQAAVNSQATSEVDRQVAVTNAEQAETNAQQAQINAEQAEDLALINGAQAALYNGNNDAAVTLAVAAFNRAGERDDAQEVLAEAAYAPGTVRLFAGHEAKVSAVAVSKDGAFALSSDEGKQLILWEIATGKKIRIFDEGHEDKIQTVAFSPDGTLAASGGQDEKAIIWDVNTGQPKFVLAEHENDVNTVAFSPNGAQLLTGGGDNVLFLWDVATGQLVRRFAEGHTQAINGVVWTPDGTGAASVGSDQELIVWDVATGTVRQRFDKVHEREIRSVAISPDGQYLLSAGNDLSIVRWELNTDNPPQSIAFAHSRDIFSLAFSPDGKSFISAGRDARIVIWDTQSLRRRGELRGHGSTVRGVAFVNNRYIISGSEDRSVRYWDTMNGAVERVFLGHGDRIPHIAYTPDGQFAVTASADDTLKLWNIATGEMVRTYEGLGGDVSSLAISSDGKYILAGGDSKQRIALFWNIETGAVASEPLGKYPKEVSAVAFSPDGTQSIMGDGSGNTVVWGLERTDSGISATRVFTFTGHTNKINYVTYNADGSLALSASADGTVLLWDPHAREDKILHTYKVGNNVRSAVFSPDGKTILTASADSVIRLWDRESEGTIQTFRGHTGEIWQAVFSPDGKTILSAADDTSVVMWNVATGQRIRRYLAHTLEARDVAFSPDGKHFLSSANDRSLILWRVDDAPQLNEWTTQHRYDAGLSCEQRVLFNLEADPTCSVTPTPKAAQ